MGSFEKTTITKHGKKYLYYYVRSSKNGSTGWVWHKYLKIGKYKAPANKVLVKKAVAAKTMTKPQMVKRINSDSTYNATKVANDMIIRINQERAKLGRSALTNDSKLTTIGTKRAVQISTDFSHTDANGNEYSEQLAKQLGIWDSYYAGEDIATGGFEDTNTNLANQLVDAYKTSNGHWSDIMNASYSKIGIGNYHSKDGVIYNTVEMGF
ncbi:CAP domain-containing protein [Lactiplantibacillus carotarum]|uniref:CAP domain-containing protein n=1 Tax=Lactiplantibacillus carotarum TaxID=2993456 RepID=UPI00298EE6FE|nr:CAP domain-containing protein [Lactiplantibacillus carotarum]